MTIRQRDVVIVPIPFTDLTTTKQRPAVVISSKWYNDDKEDYVLLPITGSFHTPLAEDMVLIRGSEINSAGLHKESVIKCGMPFTIQQDLIRRCLGQLTQSTYAKAVQILIEKVLEY